MLSDDINRNTYHRHLDDSTESPFISAVDAQNKYFKQEIIEGRGKRPEQHVLQQQDLL